jgi:hypothetical protein
VPPARHHVRQMDTYPDQGSRAAGVRRRVNRPHIHPVSGAALLFRVPAALLSGGAEHGPVHLPGRGRVG